MTWFLSEESVLIHKEYLRNLKLRYSILTKSIEGINRKNTKEVLRMRLPAKDAREILSLLPEIELHDIYFSSFSEKTNQTSEVVRSRFRSEGAFLNELYRLGIALDHGFVVVNRKWDRIEALALNDYTACFTLGDPILALDVCEHSYFSDYGFDKKRYMINSLEHLDLGKIDAMMESKK